jgi:hypothetical protein
MVVFVFYDLKYKIVVRFVGIGRMNDNQCLSVFLATSILYSVDMVG